MILDGLGFKLSTNFARCLGCPREYILYNVKEGSPGTRRVPIKKCAYVKMTVVLMP
jgi:hypothetical protein